MTKIRLLLLLLTIVVVGTLSLAAVFYARGYRLNRQTRQISPSGILVAKSEPDSAQVFINGDLTGATNSTINLVPGSYQVIIKKDGYFTWEQNILIEKEVVTEVTASLFKNAPALTPATFTGVGSAAGSSDTAKIVYSILPSKDLLGTDKSGLWILESVNLPFGFGKDPRQITNGDLNGSSWRFSPDSRQVLITDKFGSYLLDTGQLTLQTGRKNLTMLKKSQTGTAWDQQKEQKVAAQIKMLPAELADIMETKTQGVVFSPDATRVLYTASASATIAKKLIPQLPGSSTQTQERNINANRTYIYDIKEDRNFLIDEGSPTALLDSDTNEPDVSKKIIWFPNSRNVILAEPNKITAIDYDGTNRKTIYSGSYIAPYIFALGSTQKLLILTNLGAGSDIPNLYYLTVK